MALGPSKCILLERCPHLREREYPLWGVPLYTSTNYIVLIVVVYVHVLLGLLKCTTIHITIYMYILGK